MKVLLEIGQALVPWVTLVGLVVHCLTDKRTYQRKKGL